MCRDNSIRHSSSNEEGNGPKEKEKEKERKDRDISAAQRKAIEMKKEIRKKKQSKANSRKWDVHQRIFHCIYM